MSVIRSKYLNFCGMISIVEFEKFIIGLLNCEGKTYRRLIDPIFLDIPRFTVGEVLVILFKNRFWAKPFYNKMSCVREDNKKNICFIRMALHTQKKGPLYIGTLCFCLSVCLSTSRLFFSGTANGIYYLPINLKRFLNTKVGDLVVP